MIDKNNYKVKYFIEKINYRHKLQIQNKNIEQSSSSSYSKSPSLKKIITSPHSDKSKKENLVLSIHLNQEP